MANGSSCSDSFPSTDTFYAEIADDVVNIVLLALACVLTVVVVVIFIDEHLYLSKIHTNNPLRQRRVITLLGLYPMICVMALISLLVPASTQLVDLIASCYLSVCIYMFVCLMVEYFGGSDKMVEKLADDTIQMNTPPCCCCCVCLPRIHLTKKALYYIELLALQVAIIRPILLFIAAVLWTDGKYVQGNITLTSSSMYLLVLSGISTLLSMYGLIALFRHVFKYLRHQKLVVKFLAIQLAIILHNVQPLVFGVLASRFGVPACIESRGPKVRASNINHGIMIIEMFVLAMLARFAYRRPEPDSELTIIRNGAPGKNGKDSSIDDAESSTHITEPDSSALYISIISAISTLLSMYAMIVIFRATKMYMQHQRLPLKFLALQLPIVISNVQPLIFGIIARYALDCIGSRGPRMRASAMNHAVLVIEMFLLSILGRFAHRRPEPDPGTELEVDKTGTLAAEKYKKEDEYSEAESGTVGKYKTYDNQGMALDENSVEMKSESS